jgi:hypothetical protein
VSHALRVAGYRLRATLPRRWSGLVAVALLLGALGGLATGAELGARRTQSSFASFMRSTNPSDLIVLHNDSGNDSNATDAAFRRKIASLPHVKRVETANSTSEQVLGPDGFPARDATHELFDSSVAASSDFDGEFFSQDRPAVIDGRAIDPTHADEMVMDSDAAKLLDLRVGDVVPFGFYTNLQTTAPDYGTAKQTPVLRANVKLVGIVAFSNEVVRDDVDHTLKLLLFSPALTRSLTACCTNGPIAGVQLAGGSRDDAAVEAEVKQSLPGSTVIKITAVEVATAERAIAPQSVALAVFGAIAALAAIFVVGQAVGRQLRVDVGDRRALRAMGASPTMTMLDGLIGVTGAIVVGSLLAAAVGVGLSPLSPLGPVRRVDPSRGLAFDWTVLGVGTAVFVVTLTALAVLFAYRLAPHRVARHARSASNRGSRLVSTAAASGVSVSGVAGLQLALDPGRDTRAVPLRSATLGATLAIVVVVATVIFGASLSTLASHPALYGWNWNDEILGSYGGLGDIAQPQTGRLLDHDPYVAAWVIASFDNVRIDGRTVPVMGTTPNARVTPPTLSGHALGSAGDIVLGATTLSQLHKHVGDHVTVDTGIGHPRRLAIVGTATLPAIGQFSSIHLEIGTGAIVSETLIPPADLGFFREPQAVLVRFRPGVSSAAARQSLVRITQAAQNPGAGPATVVPVQHPAEIVNYRTMGDTPALLGAALALGAVTALGLTLLASVRRRRRDLALLKTLGFTRRQLAATVAWQGSVAVTVGLIVGIPLGIAGGRALWIRFADALHVVPVPTIPALTIALIATATLALANLVAVIPGLHAASTRTALLLRAAD